MKFSKFQFILDDQLPNINDFIETANEWGGEKRNYCITIKKLNGNLLWIYVLDGKTLPRGEKVFNNDTQELQQDPRSTSQAELNQQIFALYDFHKCILLLNGGNDAKSLLTKHLEKTFSKVSIKRLIATPEEFAKKVSSIKKLTLTGVKKDNLFAPNIFANEADLCGFGNPNRYKFEFKYNQLMISKDDCLAFLNKFRAKKEDCEIEALTVVGESDDGLEMMFDLNNITQSFDVVANKNNDGMFDENSVQKALLSALDCAAD